MKDKIIETAEQFLKRKHYVDVGIVWEPTPNDRMVASVSSVMEEYAASRIEGLNKMKARYCSQCGEPLSRNKHKFWCVNYKCMYQNHLKTE